MNTMNPYRRRSRSAPDIKYIRTALTIARILLIIISAAMLVFTVTASMYVGRERGSGLFGTKYFIVSDSMMEPSLESGTLISVKKAAAYYTGDLLVFKSSSPESYGSVTVRAIRNETVHNGRDAYVTYPTSTGIDDFAPAYAADVLGCVTSSNSALGSLYSFMRSPGGYMVMILLPFMLLILCEIARFFLITSKENKPVQPMQTYTPPKAVPADRARVINSPVRSDTQRSMNSVISDTAQHTRQPMQTAQHTRQNISDNEETITIPKAVPTHQPASDETTVWNKVPTTVHTVSRPNPNDISRDISRIERARQRTRNDK